MALTLLIVDDEARLCRLIEKYAHHAGYATLTAGSGEKAVALCKSHPVDFIILDVMLPGMSGFETCAALRELTRAPILMLSARGEEYDRIHGFEEGADDYVVKPFSPKELMLRVSAILARSSGGAHQRYAAGPIVLDLTARRLTVEGRPQPLTPKEFQLLALLMEHPGAALTRRELVTAVWGPEADENSRTLDTHIKQLRQLIHPYGHQIATLRAVGYRFEGE